MRLAAISADLNGERGQYRVMEKVLCDPGLPVWHDLNPRSYESRLR